MIIQLLVSLFVLFALSRVWLRYRDGSISMFGTLAWSALWIVVTIFVWVPNISERIARAIGIGRGVDVLVYSSIIVLFYGLFRLYVKLEFVEHEMTSLVRAMALRDAKKDERS